MPLCTQHSLWHEHTSAFDLASPFYSVCVPLRKTGVGKANVKDRGQKEVEEEIGKTMRQIYNGIDSGGGGWEGVEQRLRADERETELW